MGLLVVLAVIAALGLMFLSRSGGGGKDAGGRNERVMSRAELEKCLTDYDDRSRALRTKGARLLRTASTRLGEGVGKLPRESQKEAAALAARLEDLARTYESLPRGDLHKRAGREKEKAREYTRDLLAWEDATLENLEELQRESLAAAAAISAGNVPDLNLAGKLAGRAEERLGGWQDRLAKL